MTRPATLFVVATPIGNLEDITLRALRVLREVALVAAEDTRHTGNLLRHYGIETPTTSFHEHNEREKVPALLARLQSGEALALVSDAGTPAISDPGYRLVAAAIGAGIRVEVVPGPSAILTALVASGLPTSSFTFLGFPPARSAARDTWIREMADQPRTVVFFEAPHRLVATLEALHRLLGDRQVAVGRELTKLHEELVRGPLSEVLKAVATARGECTVVVGPAPEGARAEPAPADQVVLEAFEETSKGDPATRRASISALARRFGMRPREVYSAIERAKASKG